MKKDVIDVLPNNFHNALERTALLRRQALKNSKMKCTLIEISICYSKGFLMRAICSKETPKLKIIYTV